jgi:hypothetical protein
MLRSRKVNHADGLKCFAANPAKKERAGGIRRVLILKDSGYLV